MVVQRDSIKTLTKTAMMAVIVFLGIYMVKIPMPNGYTHIGDSMIFIGVLLLGGKKGALAGGMGAAVSDLLAGYAHWVLPTFFIKYSMAFCMGWVMQRWCPNRKGNWLIGAAIGGIVQVILYFIADGILFGVAMGIVNIPVNVIQTVVGLILMVVLVGILHKSGILHRLKEM